MTLAAPAPGEDQHTVAFDPLSGVGSPVASGELALVLDVSDDERFLLVRDGPRGQRWCVVVDREQRPRPPGAAVRRGVRRGLPGHGARHVRAGRRRAAARRTPACCDRTPAVTALVAYVRSDVGRQHPALLAVPLSGDGEPRRGRGHRVAARRRPRAVRRRHRRPAGRAGVERGRLVAAGDHGRADLPDPAGGQLRRHRHQLGGLRRHRPRARRDRRARRPCAAHLAGRRRHHGRAVAVPGRARRSDLAGGVRRADRRTRGRSTSTPSTVCRSRGGCTSRPAGSTGRARPGVPARRPGSRGTADVLAAVPDAWWPRASRCSRPTCVARAGRDARSVTPTTAAAATPRSPTSPRPRRGTAAHRCRGPGGGCWSADGPTAATSPSRR